MAMLKVIIILASLEKQYKIVNFVPPNNIE